VGGNQAIVAVGVNVLVGVSVGRGVGMASCILSITAQLEKINIIPISNADGVFLNEDSIQIQFILIE
jgi:hypothetical protein